MGSKQIEDQSPERDSNFAANLELIYQTEDISALSATLLSPGERELLSRCALVHAFDEHLFSTVIHTHVSSPSARQSFGGLVERTEIEALARLPGWYRLKDTHRQYYLK